MPNRTLRVSDMATTVPKLGYVRCMRGRPSSIVTADDTTGALEVAAACADAGMRSAVTTSNVAVVSSAATSPDVVVLDLRSRHLAGDEAASLLVSILERESSFRAHKIDSTLRGNWAFETTAIARAGRQVLLVPAFPAAGRTCVDGTVLVDGVPVHQTAFAADPRSPVTGSRPIEFLPSAVAAHDLGSVRAAFAGGARIVVADAATDADVAALAAHAADHPEVVVVGPASVVTSLFTGALVSGGDSQSVVSPPRRLEARALVVSASQHPIAIAQLAELVRLGIEVVRPPSDARLDDAARVLCELAAVVHQRLAADPTITTLVSVGGDTTAAMIGEAVVIVEGTIGVGIAVGSIEFHGRPLRLVTKPGGFGVAGTLGDVLGDVVGEVS